MTGFHGSLRIGRGMVATNNVRNIVGRVGSGSIILRVTSGIGVHVSGGSVFTTTTSTGDDRTSGW